MDSSFPSSYPSCHQWEKCSRRKILLKMNVNIQSIIRKSRYLVGEFPRRGIYRWFSLIFTVSKRRLDLKCLKFLTGFVPTVERLMEYPDLYYRPSVSWKLSVKKVIPNVLDRTKNWTSMKVILPKQNKTKQKKHLLLTLQVLKVVRYFLR